jgi:hypothetical protein
LDFHRTEGLVGIQTQANFGKVAKGSLAYFSGLYRGIQGGLRSDNAKWGRECWAMDEDWPLTRERHTTNCPAYIRSTTVSEGGGGALTYSPWWSTRVTGPSR